MRLARVALGWAALGSFAFAGSIPWRDPTRVELLGILAWLAITVASVVGMLTLWRRTSIGRWLVVLLGIYGTARFVLVLRSAASQSPQQVGPGVMVALIIVSSLFVALMLAALLVASLRQHWPNGGEVEASTQAF